MKCMTKRCNMVTEGGGVRRALKYSATTTLCWLTRKYKMGLRPILEMESPPGWNPGILLQQLDSTEDTQKSSSEIGFENWVWALFGPPILSVGLRVCLYFITFDYSIISLLLFGLHAFHFYFYQLCTLVLLMLLALGMKWKIYTNIHSK